MKKKYNEIEAKDNMKVEGTEEEVVEKQEKKELTKVVSQPPKKRKRSLLGRLAAGVLGSEGASGIGQYVTEEIVLPAVRNIIYSAIESTARMAIFGDKGGVPPANRNYSGQTRRDYRPATNYTSRYASTQPEPRERLAPKTSRHGVEEYVIEDRYDAAHVLNSLTEYADRYDSVSVADYYDLIGVPSQYTDNTYGWTLDSISRASIVPVRGGYVIKFPPVEVI